MASQYTLSLSWSGLSGLGPLPLLAVAPAAQLPPGADRDTTRLAQLRDLRAALSAVDLPSLLDRFEAEAIHVAAAATRKRAKRGRSASARATSPPLGPREEPVEAPLQPLREGGGSRRHGSSLAARTAPTTAPLPPPPPPPPPPSPPPPPLLDGISITSFLTSITGQHPSELPSGFSPLSAASIAAVELGMGAMSGGLEPAAGPVPRARGRPREDSASPLDSYSMG